MTKIDLASKEFEKGIDRLDDDERFFVNLFLSDDKRFKRIMSEFRAQIDILNQATDEQFRLVELACLSLICGRVLSKEQFVAEFQKALACDNSLALDFMHTFLNTALVYFVPRCFSFEAEEDAFPSFSGKQCSSPNALVEAINEDLLFRFSREVNDIDEVKEKIPDDFNLQASQSIARACPRAGIFRKPGFRFFHSTPGLVGFPSFSRRI